MEILVTGCNGQLGTEVRLALEAWRPGITTYVDLPQLDLTDRLAVEGFINNNNFTHIINCAAYTAVDRAEEEKALCSDVNVEAVRNIARAAEQHGIRIIHISTDYVFDGTNHRPYRESDKVCPMSVYGTTKRKGETALIGLAPESIVIRTSWLYSPFGHNFVKTMLSLSNRPEGVKVVSDQIGTPTYAHDLANAIVDILKSRTWVGGIFNFSNQGVCSWYDFAVAIFHNAGLDNVKVTPIPTEDYPTAATRPFYSVLDKNKIILTYGVRIPHWEASLRHCLGRMLEQEATPQAGENG